MAISVLHAQSFKSLHDVRLEGINRLSLLVGPNGAGKTSLLEACYAMREPAPTLNFEGLLQRFDLAHTPREGKDAFKLLIEDSDHTSVSVRVLVSKHRLSKGAPASGKLDVQIGKGSNGANVATPKFSVDSNKSPSQIDQAIQTWADVMDMPMAFLQLEPRSLGRAAPSADGENGLHNDGSNLASVLANMSSLDWRWMKEIIELIQEVLPQVENLRMPRVSLPRKSRRTVTVGDQKITGDTQDRVDCHRLEVQLKDQGWVPAEHVSDGTLTIIALVVALFGRSAPRLLLVDDIDHGFHPLAQKRVVGLLNTLLERSQSQMIATTHSPYLVDNVSLEDVWALYSTEGRSMCARLSSHPDFAQWSDKLRPGEFWSAIGESWVGESHKAARDA